MVRRGRSDVAYGSLTALLHHCMLVACLVSEAGVDEHL